MTPDELLDAASVFQTAMALEDVRALASDVLAHPDAEPAQRAEAARHLVWALVDLDDVDAASAALTVRTAALRAAGQDDQAALEDRHGLLLFGAEGDLAGLRADLDTLPAGAVRADVAMTLAADADEDEAIELIRRAIDDAEHDPALRSSALSVLADLLAVRGDTTEVMPHLARALSLAPRPGDRIEALMTRARLSAAADMAAEGAADADEAAALYLRHRCVRGIALASVLASDLLDQAGDTAGSLERARTAASAAQRAADAGGSIELARVLFQLGYALSAAGESTEAVAVLSRVRELEADLDDAETRGITFHELAEALADTGDAVAAIEAFGHAAALHAEVDDDYSAGAALLRSGELRLERGDTAAARADLEAALARVRGAEDPGLEGVIREVIAEADEQLRR